jgi:murein DD-endopeptidase MepM/ murein hydrolase activator NlpD
MQHIVPVILLSCAPFFTFAQGNEPIDIETPDLIESPKDSIVRLPAFSDSLMPTTVSDIEELEDLEEGEDLLEELYDSFNIETTHYPMTDFSKKTDTTFIPLLSGEQMYAHPCVGRVTSGFGLRRKYRYHYGIDVKLKTGDPVYSIFDGVVRISRRSRTYGNFVVVRHYNGLETYYAHLSKLLVKPGQEIKAGETIGLGGNTGRSRGSHLHFETRYLGAPINPIDIIDFEKGQLLTSDFQLSPYTFRYLPEVAKLKEMVFHTVRRGETLGALARRYGTSVSAICRHNGIRSTSIIRIGQRLRVR